MPSRHYSLDGLTRQCLYPTAEDDNDDDNGDDDDDDDDDID